jgi:hypothetical protein
MKNIVLFGSGTVAENNLDFEPLFIVDNNPDIEGTYFHGIEIKNPQVLVDSVASYEVIVCSTSVGEIRSQLEGYGYVWGETARVAAQLADKLEISNLESSSFKFLISSGLPSSVTSFSSGGLYVIEESDNYPSISKVYDGNTHGLIEYLGGFAFTCQGVGIVILKPDFTVAHIIKLRDGLRPHGLQRYSDMWVVVSSYQDCIVGVDDEGEERFEFKLSNKCQTFKSAQHHCNDLCIVGDYAYVSMFSVTGNWKRNCFDGGIVEINLLTGHMSTVINNLTMPHNVTCSDEGFMVLNSFKGTLLGKNFDVLATLPGFVRGFASDSQYYFIGESKNRNFNRMDGGRTPVSIDSRITIINKDLGFSKSLPLPKYISEIHSILLL